MIPNATFTTVELHINPDPAFTRKYGSQVRRAGGEFREARGRQDIRVVYVPAGEVDLINAIVKDFGKRRTTMIVSGVKAEGIEDVRTRNSIGQPGSTVYHWERGSDLEPMEVLNGGFQKTVRNFPWGPCLEQWAKEDAARAEARREYQTKVEIADLREKIAAESLLVLDGKTDLGDLKGLAGRYREVLREAGLLPPEDAPEEAAGPRM